MLFKTFVTHELSDFYLPLLASNHVSTRLKSAQAVNYEVQPAEPAVTLPGQKLEVWGKVTDKTGNHQLVLRYVGIGAVPTVENGEGYDFYSLSWEVKNETWTEKVVITKADFQQGCERQRIVSRIHSFSPDTGLAILQVGELWPDNAAGVAFAHYSWREWDLASNQEVRVAKVCKSPFEAFEEFPR